MKRSTNQLYFRLKSLEQNQDSRLREPDSSGIRPKLNKFEIQNYGFNRDVSTGNFNPELISFSMK